MRLQITAATIYVLIKYVFNYYYYGQNWFNSLYYVADAAVVLFFSLPLLKRHWVFCLSTASSFMALIRQFQIISGTDPYGFGEKRYLPFFALILGIILMIAVHGKCNGRKNI